MRKFKKNLYAYCVIAVFLSGWGGLLIHVYLFIPCILICLVGPFIFRDVKYK